jgi:hypothetical protein
MENGNVRINSLWTRHSWLVTLAVVLLVSVLGVLLDVLLVDEGLPRLMMMIFSNTLTGLIAGWLFQSFASHERSRRELMRERMQTVAELNHHIRNALQVIKYWGGSQPTLDSMQLQLINESVERIEWALREVLPKYFPPGQSSVPAPELASAIDVKDQRSQ